MEEIPVRVGVDRLVAFLTLAGVVEAAVLNPLVVIAVFGLVNIRMFGDAFSGAMPACWLPRKR
jgi:hypothetical protein